MLQKNLQRNYDFKTCIVWFTNLDFEDYESIRRVNQVQEQIEFIIRLSENPYYPVPIEEYPRLFDFEITSNGIIYFERLKKEWSSENEISDKECLYFSMLHLAYALSKKDVKECHNWQAFMFLVEKRVDVEDFKIKETLKQMGCITDNLNYNPKLYKSHLIWKSKTLSAIDKS